MPSIGVARIIFFFTIRKLGLRLVGRDDDADRTGRVPTGDPASDAGEELLRPGVLQVEELQRLRARLPPGHTGHARRKRHVVRHRLDAPHLRPVLRRREVPGGRVHEPTREVTGGDPDRGLFRAENWLEIGWSMPLISGGAMSHTLRRAYPSTGEDVVL